RGLRHRVDVVCAAFHHHVLAELRAVAQLPFQQRRAADGRAALGFALRAHAAEVAGTDFHVQRVRVRLVGLGAVTDADGRIAGIGAELVVDVGDQRKQLAMIIVQQLVARLGRCRIALRGALAHLLPLVVGDLFVLEVAGQDVFIAPVVQFLFGVDLAGDRGADRVAGGGDGAQFCGGVPAVGIDRVEGVCGGVAVGQRERGEHQERFHRHEDAAPRGGNTLS
ncbi:conserved hypothetical protein, partial [Ricinus communis]